MRTVEDKDCLREIDPVLGHVARGLGVVPLELHAMLLGVYRSVNIPGAAVSTCRGWSLTAAAATRVAPRSTKHRSRCGPS